MIINISRKCGSGGKEQTYESVLLVGKSHTHIHGCQEKEWGTEFGMRPL
jgi:hypothetical protein